MDRKARLDGLDPTRLAWRRRALRAALLGGLASLALATMSASAALAADDDEEDDLTFEQKIIRNLMHGIGAVDGTEKGITYQERSPLVVPPKIDLPPPQAGQSNLPANWPKDRDIEERKKLRQLAKKRDKSKESWAPLTPEELNPKGAATIRSAQRPGSDDEKNWQPLSPSQLGVNLTWSNVFGGQKTESEPFKGEPPRDSLTQPPVGYQTPSPSYAYGTGPLDNNKRYNPDEEYSVYPKQPGKY